jgi:uncharacterized protein
MAPMGRIRGMYGRPTGMSPAAGAPHPLRRALLTAAAATVLGASGRTWAGLSGRTRFDHGLLWRVERDGTPASCVFGTIHLADARVAEPSAAVLAELSRSRTLVMELAVDAIVDPSVFDQEELADGGKLEPLIGAEAYAETRRLLLARGVSERVIAEMKPWAAMLAVASSGPRDASVALDMRLLAAARHAHLRVEALELVEEQIASFDTVPLASQIALLKHALAHRDALEAENETMIKAWLKGDLAELARFPARMDRENPGVARHYDQLVRHLIYDRTVLMHHRLTLPLRSGRLFVAVGALHLQGTKGLLALIEQDGYRVTRIS